MEHRHQPTRTGFTMIELLTVIGIIAVLSGLLMAGLSIARKQSQKTKARALIMNVDAAISRFHSLNAQYPNSYDISNNGMIESSEQTNINDTASKNNEILTLILASVDGDLVGQGSGNVSGGRIVDVWGQALHYRPFYHYPAVGNRTAINTGDQPYADSDPIARPDSYQLWSNGPNIIDDRGRSDDITNW